MIEKAQDDPRFCNHPGLELYGIQSYIAVPLFRRSGAFFGTLCALDPRPAKELSSKVPLFKLLADLLAHEMDQVTEAEERERFLSVVAHDLRNPLGAIAAGVELIEEDEPLSPLTRRCVDVSRSSLRRIDVLIDDLLDLSRGRFGEQLTLVRSEFDLARLLNDLVHETLLPVDVPVVIDAPNAVTGTWDRGRLSQLFANLLDNAKAHSPREGQVRIRVYEREGLAIVEVANSGDPIPAAILPDLFEPFVRGSATASRDHLGLGLYIAATVATSHGGAISVSSDEEAGTVFRVTLPTGTPETF